MIGNSQDGNSRGREKWEFPPGIPGCQKGVWEFPEISTFHSSYSVVLEKILKKAMLFVKNISFCRKFHGKFREIPGIPNGNSGNFQLILNYWEFPITTQLF